MGFGVRRRKSVCGYFRRCTQREAEPDCTAGYSRCSESQSGRRTARSRFENGQNRLEREALAVFRRPYRLFSSTIRRCNRYPRRGVSCSVDGHLRAYSAVTGEVVWDVDTARAFDTVNGNPARGGSMDGAGPAIVNGMLFVNSGYGQSGGMPGNVLLAFSIEGK